MLTVNRLYSHFDPWHVWQQLQNDFDEFLGATVTAPGAPINMAAKDDAVVLFIDLPGRSPEQLHVSVHRDIVTVEADSADPILPEGAKAIREERLTPAVTRQVRLPFEVDPGKVDATYEKGILRIQLERHESTLPAKIEVKAQ